MRTDIWENMVSVNSHGYDVPKPIATPPIYKTKSCILSDFEKYHLDINLDDALGKDQEVLPATDCREGYYGDKHFDYWLSGLRDHLMLLACCEKYGIQPNDYLDIGCATGRVIRHFAFQSGIDGVYGADINRSHIDWVNYHLGHKVKCFQITSIPYIPVCSHSFDLISAFSVFTHIESFDTMWIMELKRILKRGGIAWITLHTENTWRDIDESWPLYKGLRNHPEYKKLSTSQYLPKERLVFRWQKEQSYSANVFYHSNYIERVWGKFFNIEEIRRRHPGFQDVVILRSI